ncbi:hypothetical protein [Jeotgalibacillus terrae]|uniref:Phage portal protein n=1 Tax=Jeotgalibacillus terrae TaxID=587735 RepID=A0ABW5ZG93_9BACL|nr:hypothetical protein [Jeotgalibacillus terrae]MBM7577665.1 hypothetical protein [Jeotgalibacillus terrae]
MDIFLSINNREQVIRLPIVPEEFEIKLPYNNETFNRLDQKALRLIGLEGLKTITLQSFFPNRYYSFARDQTYRGFEYIEIIEAWMARRVPIRLIITDTPINMAASIDEITYTPRDGSTDVYYTLSLSQFNFVHERQDGHGA